MVRSAAATVLLSRSDVAELLSLSECIEAVESAFREYGDGKISAPGVLGFHSGDGSFHVKAGLTGTPPYFAAKTNSNYPHNMQQHGLPAIQGVIVLCDGKTGFPVAVMDSMEITVQRTGAATAVAAKYLARKNSSVATICGCGNQGRIQLRALRAVVPLNRVFAYDTQPEAAERYASDMSRELEIEVAAVSDLGSAIRKSDLCVTCTPSRRPLVMQPDVRPGTFIAAVGADSPEKQELDPRLVASGKLVTDILEQCATMGELHHALEQRLLTKDAVHGELGELVTGKKPGRVTDEEITIFDSTGTAIQDVAAAVAVYQKAVQNGHARTIFFAD